MDKDKNIIESKQIVNVIYKIGYYYLIIGLIVCIFIQNYFNVIWVFNFFYLVYNEMFVCLFC